MRLELDAPSSAWVRVPTDPSSASDEGWVDEALAGVRRRHPGASAEQLDAVRQAVLRARDGVLPGAAVGLLYLPEPNPFGLLVSIGISEPQAIEGSLVRALLGEAELVGRPIVDPVEVPGVGAGISVRCLFAPAAADRKPAAGLAYLLQGERATVRVMASPAPQELVAHAAPSLAKIVASLRLVD
ncbi:hypothetical protein ACFVTX_04540 [Agromyces sp. NPDC058136]|uniref:hypothetical protein n=1 Tax=Agromyces sp. NPDC058136 TaxID=3346354 RepID=UPI0036DF240D